MGALAKLTAPAPAPLAGTYICNDPYEDVCPCAPVSFGGGPGHCYHESTRRRLAWQYGEARADEIMNGTDDASYHDEMAWNRLGRRA